LFINNRSWHRYQKVLDEVLMLNASKTMEGEHDFFAFQKSGSKRTNSITKIKKIDIKTENLIGFEIFLENFKLSRKTLKDQKLKFSVSDFQKSERDFAFVVNKDVEAQELISVISNVNPNLISNIKVFDVYEGENIPDNQKSIAISITIQSSEKTLNDKDLEKINNSIIEAVENQTGAKIRS